MDIPPYSGERDVVEADWNAPANPLADLQAFRKMLESQSHSLPTRQIYLTGQQAITAWERGDMSLQDSSVQILIPYRDAELVRDYLRWKKHTTTIKVEVDHFFDFGGSSPSCGTDGSSSPSPIPLPTTITPLDSSSRSRID